MNTVKWVVVVVVVALVAAGAAGFGGYSMGKTAGTQQALTARQNFLAARGFGGNGQTGGTGGAAGGQAGFAGGQGGANGQGFARGGNFGQIKDVSGDTLDLSTATAVVKVKLTNQTQIEKQAAGTMADLQPGERITVVGDTGSDGTVTATRIQLLPQAPAGGNGGQQPGGRSQQGGTPQSGTQSGGTQRSGGNQQTAASQ
jgi:hypothetical protein